MAKIDIKKLKMEAEKFRGKGKLDKAIELYEEIEKAKGADAKTLQKMAEIYLKLGRENDGIQAYRKAITGYLATGFLVQAIAVGKILQELRPDDEDIKKGVEQLLAKKFTIPVAKLEPRKIQAGGDEAEEAGQEKPKEKEPAAAEQKTEPASEEISAESGGEPVELEETVEPEPASDSEAIELEQPAEEEKESSIEFLLFADLSQEQFSRVYQKLRSVKIPAGVRICRENDPGDTIFIIAQGEAEVTKMNPQSEERLLAKLGPGQFFGEFGYFTDSIRHATVEAITDLELLEISKQDMDEIVAEFPQVKEVILKFYKQRVLDNLLVLSPLTAVLSAQDRKKLIAGFELREFPPLAAIVKEGDPGDSMFLIKSGQAEVTTIDPKDRRKLTLARLGPGEFFGEVSLIKNKPRTATITALTKMELLVITREKLGELTKDHPEMVSLIEQTIEQRVEDTIKKIIGEQE